jgi:uncharacterized protein (DUF983 family)
MEEFLVMVGASVIALGLAILFMSVITAPFWILWLAMRPHFQINKETPAEPTK